MTPSQKFLKKLGLKDQDITETNAENKTDVTENSRRSFLKKSTLGGIALAVLLCFLLLKNWLRKARKK